MGKGELGELGEGGTLGPNHECSAMNIQGPKDFTTVFGKQIGPSYRMDPQGPQSDSLEDLDLLVQIINIKIES